MIFRKFGALFCVSVVAALCAASCATTQTAGPALLIPDSLASLIQTLSTRDMSIKTLRLRARVKVKTEEGKSQSTTVNIALKRSGSMRVEILGPVDEVEGLLVIGKGTFTLLNMQDMTYRTGNATEEAVYYATGVPLSPVDLESTLIGSFTLPEFTQGQFGTDEKTGELLVMFDKPGVGAQIVRVGGKTVSVQKVELLSAAGKIMRTVEFRDISMVSGIPFPHALTAVFEGKGSVELKFREIGINEPMDDSEFRQDVPPGFNRAR
jgi:outer membrane lipoprotein-sorting protein